MGRRGPRVHRLSPELGPCPARSRAPGHHRGGAAPAAQGHDLLLPQRAGDPARPQAGRCHPVRRRRALHRLGHGGDLLRAAHRPRLHEAQQGPQVRGRLARHARLRSMGHGARPAVGLPACAARFRGRPARDRRDGAGHALQRRRRRGEDDRAPRARARRGDGRATAAGAHARSRVPEGGARGDAQARHRDDLRRDRHRLPCPWPSPRRCSCRCW